MEEGDVINEWLDITLSDNESTFRPVASHPIPRSSKAQHLLDTDKGKAVSSESMVDVGTLYNEKDSPESEGVQKSLRNMPTSCGSDVDGKAAQAPPTNLMFDDRFLSKIFVEDTFCSQTLSSGYSAPLKGNFPLYSFSDIRASDSPSWRSSDDILDPNYMSRDNLEHWSPCRQAKAMPGFQSQTRPAEKPLSQGPSTDGHSDPFNLSAGQFEYHDSNHHLFPHDNPSMAPYTSSMSLTASRESARGRNRRKRRLAPEQRLKAKTVRRVGACLRCKVYKESCDENTPCQNCLRKQHTTRIMRQPCYREPLENVVPSRLGKAVFGQTRAELPKLRWSATDTAMYTIQITDVFTKTEHPRILTLRCRRFASSEKRMTTDLLWDSKYGLVRQQLPLFAIYDTEIAKAKIEAFAESNMSLIEGYLLRNTSNEVSLLVRREARRFADLNPESGLGSALKIFNLAFYRRYETFNGEQLGIDLVQDKNVHYYGTRPLPRLINHQLDIIFNNTIIDRHRKAVLARLKSVIFGKNAISAWYEVFLTIYILLETLERVYQHQVSECARSKGTVDYTNFSFVTNNMLEEWQYSAQILIAHFRCIIRGHLPFSQTIKESRQNLSRASLDSEAMTFFDKLSAALEMRRQDLENLRNNPPPELNRPFVWLSQLFQG